MNTLRLWSMKAGWILIVASVLRLLDVPVTRDTFIANCGGGLLVIGCYLIDANLQHGLEKLEEE